MGACDDQDRTVLALLDPNARQIAANCGLSPTCEGETDETAFSDCVTNCVEPMVTNLSSECSSCYGEYAWCSRDCEDSCAADSCGVVCNTCLASDPYDLCIPKLTECTGRRMSLDCIDPT
jgi:hypothetical protein